jgi:hypothetical protein
MRIRVRTLSWLLAALLVVGGTLVALQVRGASAEPLLVIARSKNANVVRYDLRLTKSGAYDVRRPLDAYWLMRAEDGRREELKGLEHKAYGYELVPGATATTFVFRLVAMKDRPLTVRRRGSRFGAELPVAGDPARLDRVFVATKEGIVPRVLYIELSGRRISDGKPVRERIHSQ